MKEQKGKAPAGDIELAYTSVGTGRTLVVLHGGPGLGHTYMRGVDVVADSARVVFYDQRGCGETPLGDEAKVTFSGTFEDLEALRASLGSERIDVIGHSSGGLLALLYAAHHPESVESLILYATAPPFVPELAARLMQTMESRRTPADNDERARIEASEGFTRRDPATLERYYLNKYLGFFDDRGTVDRVEMGFTEITAANVLQMWERMFRDYATLDPAASLARVACPTLVIHCENDAVPEDFSRLLADKIAGAEYAFLSGVNHFAHIEAPEVFAAPVRAFLRAHAV